MLSGLALCASPILKLLTQLHSELFYPIHSSLSSYLITYFKHSTFIFLDAG